MNMFRRHARKFLTISSIICLLAGSGSTAFAGFDLLASTTKLYELHYTDNPGDTVKDYVIIKNTGKEPITLKMYSADGMLTRQGTFTVSSDKDKQRTVGLWTELAENKITVEGESEKKVSFTIKVPEKLTPGSYAGGIVVSTIEKDRSGQKGSGVSVISRSVLPVYVTIPGKIVHKFDWQDFSHEVNSVGNHNFDMKFKNIGNTVIIFQTTVEIYGQPDGIDENEVIRSQKQKETANYTKEDQKRLTDQVLANTMSTYEISLFQDQDISIPLTWKKQPLFGEYTAKATTTFWELNLTSGIKSNPKAITKEIKFSVTPLWLILLTASVFLLLILAVLGRFLLRHFQKQHAEKYIVQENDTLTNIAEKQKVNWKKIAKLNKLHPPYELKKDQTILVPKSKK